MPELPVYKSPPCHHQMSQHAGRTRQHTFAQMLIGQYPFATYIYGLQCVVCTVLYIVHDLHINIVCMCMYNFQSCTITN